MIQTNRNPIWLDESKVKIPYSRVTKTERLHEVVCSKIVTKAQTANKKLVDFKQEIKELVEEAEKAFVAEYGIERAANYKGNFTMFNFDRSIKIERSVNELITYDEALSIAAKDIFMSFITNSITASKDWVKGLILDVFETKGGKLDPKKVNLLMRHESRANDPEYSRGCALLKKAERRPDSKTYYRVWVKDEEGEYKAIELNFSNI